MTALRARARPDARARGRGALRRALDVVIAALALALCAPLLVLDLKILARTPALVVRGSGLYKGGAGGWEGEL